MLNLGGGGVDTINKRRDAGKDLGGRLQIITGSRIRNARRLMEEGETAAQVAFDLGMTRATLYRRAGCLGLTTDHPVGKSLTTDAARQLSERRRRAATGCGPQSYVADYLQWLSACSLRC